MMHDKKIAFIGAGNMAGALISGLCRSGVSGDRILAIDSNSEQLARVSQAYQVSTTASPNGDLAGCDVVVWSVKPQVLNEAMARYAKLTKDALHISVVAGVRTKDLVGWSGCARMVRAMPNTSALIGEGVCGLFAAEEVSSEDRSQAAQILASTGTVFWVDSDEKMNAVTALTGSGPAYVFHFLEGLIVSARQLGFPPEQARQLTLTMAAGAIKQARCQLEDLGELRARVTSKGGTTEAAIAVLDQKGTQSALTTAVLAADERAREMADMYGQATL